MQAIPTPTVHPGFTGAAAAVAPAITARALTPSATDLASYSLCNDYAALTACEGRYESCIEGVGYTGGGNYNQLYSSYSSCYCAYGAEYLSCYSSWLYTDPCYSTYTNLYTYSDYYNSDWWASYETSWFQQYCGTVPPLNDNGPTSIPTSVSLQFASVTIVTHSGPVTQPSYTNTPMYSGSGSLLQGACRSTSFTLVDVGSTVFWAPFVGCVSDRPDCCPYTVATTALAGVTQDTTVTMTVTADGGSGQNQAVMAYPQPADNQIMKSCATDYYSISGNCCPKNYFPFTRALAGATPCYSSLHAMATVPTLTAGLAGEPTDTSKPTSAVVNVVWAMSYPVQSNSGGLSTGAIVGISVGGAAALGIIGLLSFCLYRSRRKDRKAGAAAAVVPPGGAVPPMQQAQNLPPDATRGSVVPSSGTPSMLVPQQTGTNSISELSSLSSGHQPLIHQNGYGPARTPSVVSTVTPSPGMPPSMPNTIPEADEGAPRGGAYPFPQQHQPQQPPMPPGMIMLQPGQPLPPGMVLVQGPQPGMPMPPPGPMHPQQQMYSPPMQPGFQPPPGGFQQPPPVGYPPQGYPPQGYPPQGYPPHPIQPQHSGPASMSGSPMSQPASAVTGGGHSAPPQELGAFGNEPQHTHGELA